MIKFFRKIRHRLITESKTSKYLLYAIGEILLVVLGILIALQLNSWSESRKSNTLELKYLERLKNDLVLDTIYYDQSIRGFNRAIEANTNAIKMAYGNQSNIMEFQELLGSYDYNMQNLTIHDDTYREMTSAGNFNIIRNDLLKESITKLYGKSDQVVTHFEEYNSFNRTLLTNLNETNVILKYYPYASIQKIFTEDQMFNKSDWEFINDPTSHKFRILENCMLTYVLRLEELLPELIDLKEESSMMIETLMEEINNHKL